MYRRFLLTLILSLCTSAWGTGLTYSSPQYPYRLDVAAGWAQVPDTVLTERKKSLPLDFQGLVFETIFHLQRPGLQQADKELSLPYIIVQPLGLVSQGLITEKRFDSVINKMRDARKMPIMQKRLDQMSPDGAKLIREYTDLVTKAGIYTVKPARKFWIITDSPASQEEKLAVVTGGVFLPNGILVQLSGYCAQNELQNFVPVFLGMLNSLRGI